MAALCRLFRSEIVFVGRRIRMPPSNAASVRTFPMGNNIQWQGFVGYSIAMAKRFLNYICCNPFIRSVGAKILKIVNLIQRIFSSRAYSVFTFLVVSLFVSNLRPTFMQKSMWSRIIVLLVSQSARKICKFVFGSYSEVDILFANRDLFPPSDCNGVNEVINEHLDLIQENLEKALRQDTTLANSETI